MAEPQINAFLKHLAVKENVSALTQNQALSALLFLYRHVLDREIGDLGEIVRARKPKRLPVVMIRDEVKAVLASLSSDKWLMASLMYGTGPRLMECLPSRTSILPATRSSCATAKARRTGSPCGLSRSGLRLKITWNGLGRSMSATWPPVWGRVVMADALDRKYPNAPREWRWQWVSPQENRWKNTKTGEEGRHYVHETILQGAVREAVRESGVVKHVGCHAFRHSFATHLLEGAMTSARSRNSWGTKTSAPPLSTRTS